MSKIVQSRDQQYHRNDGGEPEAVVGEGTQGVVDHVAQEELDRQVPDHRGGDEAHREHERLGTSHPLRHRLGELQRAGPRDDGDAHQEREAGRIPAPRPRKSPSVIVAPERETPGTSAAACATPIPIASENLSLSAPRVLLPTASPTINSTPTSTRLKTTTQGLRTDVSKKSSRKNPIRAAGMVDAR